MKFRISLNIEPLDLERSASRRVPLPVHGERLRIHFFNVGKVDFSVVVSICGSLLSPIQFAIDHTVGANGCLPLFIFHPKKPYIIRVNENIIRANENIIRANSRSPLRNQFAIQTTILRLINIP
jgi:hypothetical protein